MTSTLSTASVIAVSVENRHDEIQSLSAFDDPVSSLDPVVLSAILVCLCLIGLDFYLGRPAQPGTGESDAMFLTEVKVISVAVSVRKTGRVALVLALAIFFSLHEQAQSSTIAVVAVNLASEQ